MLLALDTTQASAPEAILTIEVDPVLPLSTAAVELGTGVFPHLTVEGEGEILEVVVPLGTRDLLTRRFAHGGS